MPAFDNPNAPLAIFATLASLATVKFAFGLLSRWNRKRSFVEVGTVSSIFCYPIKSCGGMELKTAECSKHGVKSHGVTDRHWIVVKPNGDFLTQRQMPAMALIKATSKGRELSVEAPEMPPLKVPIDQQTVKSEVVSCRVWNDQTKGVDCGKEAGEWISKFLGLPGLRLLVSTPQLKKRDASVGSRPGGIENLARPGDEAAYSDWCAYLIANTASLKQLNSKLSSPVSMTNFRPNIVIEYNIPFDEDNWEEVKIGNSVTLRMLDPCTRCKMTTMDSSRGQFHESGEPLNTLKKFRCTEKYGSSPLFGMNATVDVEGTVSVGDTVYAVKKSTR